MFYTQTYESSESNQMFYTLTCEVSDFCHTVGSSIDILVVGIHIHCWLDEVFDIKHELCNYSIGEILLNN